MSLDDSMNWICMVFPPWLRDLWPFLFSLFGYWDAFVSWILRVGFGKQIQIQQMDEAW